MAKRPAKSAAHKTARAARVGKNKAADKAADPTSAEDAQDAAMEQLKQRARNVWNATLGWAVMLALGLGVGMLLLVAFVGVFAAGTPDGKSPVTVNQYTGSGPSKPAVYGTPTPSVTPAATPQGVGIGGDIVPDGTFCAEDEVITYRNIDEFGEAARVAGSGVGCVHYEYVIMDFLLECVYTNSETGPDTLARLHAADPEYGSWCSTVVDDSSDGFWTINDLILDSARP